MKNLNHIFESVLKNYYTDELTQLLINELIEFQKFVNTLHSMSIHKLLESTQAGKVYLSDLDRICQNIHKYNNRLQEFIDKNIEPAEFEYRNIIRDLNTIRTPTVLSILENVFSDNGYDEEDKKETHKYCQIYDYLLGQFKNKVHHFQLKFVHLRKYSIKDLNMKTRKSFITSDEEILRKVNGT